MADPSRLKVRMIELLLSSPLGCIYACNILDALEEDLVGPDFAARFLKHCLDNYDEAECKSAESLIALFARRQSDNSRLQKISHVKIETG